jgi:hypothetical protein
MNNRKVKKKIKIIYDNLKFKNRLDILIILERPSPNFAAPFSPNKL